MPGCRGGISVRETLVKIDLVVAIEVMQTTDLIAPQGVDFVLVDNDSQEMMHPGRNPLPCGLLGVEPRYHPHVPLHAHDHPPAITHEGMGSRSDQRVPRILRRQFDRVDHIARPPLAKSNRRLKRLRPLGLSTQKNISFRMLSSRRDRSLPSPIGIKAQMIQVHLALMLNSENHLLATAIDAPITSPLGSRDQLPERTSPIPKLLLGPLDPKSVDVSMPYIREPNKAACPNCLVSQRVGVEAGRRLFFPTDSNRNGPRHRFSLTDQNVALHRT